MKRVLVASTIILTGLGALTFAQSQSQQEQAQQRQQQQQQREQQQEQRQEQQRAQLGSQQIQPMQKSEEQHFIKEASSDNNLEIKLGQLIEQKVQDQQIRQLAQRLVQDHQKAEQQLQQVAQQIGVSLSQEQLSPVAQAKLQEMQKKQGQQLETAFCFCQVGDHHTDVLMNEFVAQNAQDQQVKQYAQQQIPVLREHLRLAEQCAERFVPEARTAGEHMRGTGQHMRDQINHQLNSNNQNGQSSGSQR